MILGRCHPQSMRKRLRERQPIPARLRNISLKPLFRHPGKTGPFAAYVAFKWMFENLGRTLSVVMVQLNHYYSIVNLITRVLVRVWWDDFLFLILKSLARNRPKMGSVQMNRSISEAVLAADQFGPWPGLRFFQFQVFFFSDVQWLMIF